MVHNVFFWLKPDADSAKFEAGAKSLLDIDVVGSGTVRKTAATPERAVTDKSFSYHLSLTFASIDDHNTYQDHPHHHEFVENCLDLWERAVVYDSEAI